METIQELLAAKPCGNPKQTQYVDTVEAYDKWAEVCIYILFAIIYIQHSYNHLNCIHYLSKYQN